MRGLGRALGELGRVVLAGFVGFLVFVTVLLAGAVGRLFMAACGLATVLLLFMSLFCGVGWFFTHKPHELLNAGGFLIEAAVPFVLLVVVSYYREKLARGLEARRQRRAALRRIGTLRLAPKGVVEDASFEP